MVIIMFNLMSRINVTDVHEDSLWLERTMQFHEIYTAFQFTLSSALFFLQQMISRLPISTSACSHMMT